MSKLQARLANNNNHMKLVNIHSSKSFYRGKYNELTSIQRESMSLCKDQSLASSIAVHLGKKESCPFIKTAYNLKGHSLQQDQSRFARISTKAIYESRNEIAAKEDWKILSLREIKDLKSDIVKQQKLNKKGSGNKKLYVSVSKQNKSLLSRKNCGVIGPKLSQIGGKMELLRIMKGGRKIVEAIEYQIEQRDHKNRFFCD